MSNPTSGSLRLFHALGVSVYMHWSWFLVAILMVTADDGGYDAPAWRVAQYVSLFLIVLLHEYGHALACRQVGGTADTIVLWPLGGIAYVAPPDRPGAVLWSIAAGPLVNVALLAPTWALYLAARNAAAEPASDWVNFCWNLAMMNVFLLAFNLVPAYPLDGGQVLMALLWFQVGRWTALLCVSVIGLGLSALLLVVSLACILANPWLGWLVTLMAVFTGMRSLAALQASRHFLRMESLARRAGCACPRCRVAPPTGPLWSCDHCEKRFDLFEARGKCPDCGAWYLEPRCPDCGETSHIDRWFAVGAEAQLHGAEGPHGPSASSNDASSSGSSAGTP